MKSSFLKRLSVIVIFCCLCHTTFAQQPATISQLEQQIAEKEAVDRDPSTTSEVRKLNREFLDGQRRQLRDVLVAEISGFQNYLTHVSHSNDEKAAIGEKLQSLQAKLTDLNRVLAPGGSNDTQVATAETPPPVVQPKRIQASFSQPSETMRRNRETDSRAPAGSISLRNSPPPVDCDLSNVPPVIKDEAGRKANDIVNRNDATRVGDLSDRMILFSVIDALTRSDVLKLSALEAYTNIGETTRTDKQLGTTASSAGSTSAIEKPGWASLLGFAVERGAIQQNVGATALTLSTTPYAFLVPSAQDTAAANRQYGYLKRLGLSASFNISNQNNPLANARRNNLSQYSAKLRLFGERGPNSKDFTKRWDDEIRPAIQQYLNSLTGGIETLFDQRPEMQEVRDNFNTTSVAAINEVLTGANLSAIADATAKKTASDKAKADVAKVILCTLKSQVFDQTRADGTGPFKIDQATRDHLVGMVLPSLIAARKEVGKAKDLFAQMLKDFERKPTGSLSFVENRPATGTEYGTLNFLYQRYLGDTPIKFTFNAGPSFYHRPDPKLNQQTFRDFITTFSFEGRRDSPFKTTELDLSPMTYSLTGRYQRLQENKGVANKKADLAVVQFKLEVPISKGFSLPLSLTYANASEQNKEKHIRGNFGLTFDVDKFLAITKVLSMVR